MSHASFEVAAAKSNLRTLDNPPTRQMEESMEDTMTIEMTESQQSMIRFNQVSPRSNLQRQLPPLIQQHCHLITPKQLLANAKRTIRRCFHLTRAELLFSQSASAAVL